MYNIYVSNVRLYPSLIAAQSIKRPTTIHKGDVDVTEYLQNDNIPTWQNGIKNFNFIKNATEKKRFQEINTNNKAFSTEKMKGKKKKKEIIKEQNMVEKEAELDNEKD